MLGGRRAGRKLTPQIEAYVRLRWSELSRSGTYGQLAQLDENVAAAQETHRDKIPNHITFLTAFRGAF